MALVSISFTIIGYIIYKSSQYFISKNHIDIYKPITYVCLVFLFLFIIYYLSQFYKSYLIRDKLTDITAFTKGFIGSKNNTGMLLASSVPFLTLLLVKSNKKRLYIGMILLAVLTLIVTVCRNGVASVTIFYLTMFSLSFDRNNFRYILLSLLIIAIILIGLISFLIIGSSFDYFTTVSIYGRLHAWIEAIKLLSGWDWIFGKGAGQWEYYKDLNRHMPFVHPHNDFIRLIVEHGVVGFFLFSFSIFILLYQLIKKLKFQKTGVQQIDQKMETIILISGLLVFVILMSFDEIRLKYNHSTFLWFWIGICSSKLPNIDPFSVMQKYLIPILSIILLIYCGLIGKQNYWISRAVSNTKIENYSQAIADYQTVQQNIVNRSGYNPICTKIGGLYRKQNMETEEVKSYENCMQVFPRQKLNNQRLFNYYFKNENFYKAFNQLRYLIKSNPCDKYFARYLPYYLDKKSYQEEAAKLLYKHNLCYQ